MVGRELVVGVALFSRIVRVDGNWVAFMKEMKKGVFSPSNGAVLLSVVLPRKSWSSRLAGSGEGGSMSREWRKFRNWRREPENGVCRLAITACVREVSEMVPLPKVIANLKFG